MADAIWPWQAAHLSVVGYPDLRPDQAVGDLFDAAVQRFAERPCLDFLGLGYSFRDVGQSVARAAKGFQELGVGKGTRVALFLPNTPYYVICYYAILKAGGIVVNVNPLYTEREVHRLVRDAGIEIMVTLDLGALYAKAAGLLANGSLGRLVVCPMTEILPFARKWLFRLLKRGEVAPWKEDAAHIPFAALLDNDGACEAVAIDPATDIAVLQYTGGTTGTPKGAMLTHGNLLANLAQCRIRFPGVGADGERVLAVLPFFHAFAMTTALNFGIAAGSEIVMVPRFALVDLLRTIDRTKPTIFPGVPTLFMAIAKYKEIGRYDLSSIRFCISGGAPLPSEVKAGFEKLTGCTLVEGYGLTEASPVVACNPFDGVDKAGSVGPPLPGTVVEIAALDGSGRIMPTGERGEVCIRGPQVMSGYWRQPEETARVLEAGRLRTGDVGYLDEDGYLFLVDRIKDIIIASGYKIYPRNVEEAIYQHSAVAECIVLGLPDPYRGQTVKAYIVRASGRDLTAEGLLAFLADKLSPLELPKEIEFRPSLPKTTIGKLSKEALLAEETARRAAAPPAAFR